MDSIANNQNGDSEICTYAHNRHAEVQAIADKQFNDNLFRDDWRANKRQETIWRAIGNLMLNGISLYWITLKCENGALNWIDKHSILKQEWLILRRKWQYQYPDKEYVLIASGGVSGRNPHYHIISTAPLPDRWQSSDIDSSQELIQDTATDRKRIARYCEINLREKSPFTSQEYRTSKDFPLWSDTAVYHLYCVIQLPSIGIVHYATKSAKVSEAIPSFKECRYCNAILPETVNYFVKNGDSFRTECKHCNVLYQKGVRANRNHSHAGLIDIDSWVSYCLERRVKSLYLDDYTSELIPLSEISIDHMTAIASGGENSNMNVCLTSLKNNREKSTMSFNAWIRLLYSAGIENEFTPYVDCSDISRQLPLFESVS